MRPLVDAPSFAASDVIAAGDRARGGPRAETLTPARLLERLSEKVRNLLASTSRDVVRSASARCAPTLRLVRGNKLILRLCTGRSGAALRVRRRGWTLEAAEFVVRLHDRAALVEDKSWRSSSTGSLVRRAGSDAATGHSRFGHGWWSVREYAAEKRQEGSEAPDGAEARPSGVFCSRGCTSTSGGDRRVVLVPRRPRARGFALVSRAGTTLLTACGT
jgi:hypothetical protein